MKQGTVGRSGLRVSRIGLGTMTWGRETSGDDAAAQLAAFAEAGGTLVDTSPAYGGAQRILAELLGDVVARDVLVLSGHAGIVTDGLGAEVPDAGRRTLLHQLDSTLRELGTDHLDVWQVAAWDPLTPIDELAATLEYAVASGRTRYVGVHGFAGWQLATLAQALGGRLVAAQDGYSLLDRTIEQEGIPAARHHGVGVFADTPLAGGILTGKYRTGIPADSRGADEVRGEEVRAHLTDRTNRVVEAVVTAADGLGTSPLAVALAWVRDRDGVASTIVGGRDIAQLTGVLAGEELELPGAISAALDDVSA